MNLKPIFEPTGAHVYKQNAGASSFDHPQANLHQDSHISKKTKWAEENAKRAAMYWLDKYDKVEEEAGVANMHLLNDEMLEEA